MRTVDGCKALSDRCSRYTTCGDCEAAGCWYSASSCSSTPRNSECTYVRMYNMCTTSTHYSLCPYLMYSTQTSTHYSLCPHLMYSTQTSTHYSLCPYLMYSTQTSTHSSLCAYLMYSTQTSTHSTFCPYLMYSTQTSTHSSIFPYLTATSACSLNNCFSKKTCNSCSNGCLWCPSLKRCTPSIQQSVDVNYPSSYPFGQCLGWAGSCPGNALTLVCSLKCIHCMSVDAKPHLFIYVCT